MTKEERLQAAQVAFNVFCEQLAKDYGVAVTPSLRNESFGIQVQITPQINLAILTDWVLPPTVKSEGDKGNE